MPSVTRTESCPELSSTNKKRRRDDDGGDAAILYDALSVRRTPMVWARDEAEHLPYEHNSNTNERLVFHQASPNRGGPNSVLTVPRKIIPLPISKRMRVSDENDSHIDAELISSDSSEFHHLSSRQHDSHAHQLQQQSQPPVSRPSTTRTASSALLSPCHICHRKPTKKSDLDSFADCMGCGHRTCFVCIRKCQGWLAAAEQDLASSFTMQDVGDEREPPQQQQRGGKVDSDARGSQGWNGSGHRSMVCSRCCVERGSEGDVVCLGCLAGMAGA